MTGIIMVMRGKLLYATLLHIYVYVRIRYALNLCATSDELDACMGAPQSCMHGMQFMAMLESFLSSLHLLINALAKS